MLSYLCGGHHGRKRSTCLLYICAPECFGGGLGLLPQGTGLLFLNTGFL